jgi:dihydrolipoamide dehydrogenase
MGLMGAASPSTGEDAGLQGRCRPGNTKGIEFLFKKNKVTWLKGWAASRPGQVKVGDDTHSAKNIVIATGSEASSPGVTVDEKHRHLHRRADPGEPAEVDGRHRRGRRAEMGSVYARLGAQSDGRISRRDHPRHGCRGRQELPAHPEKQGLKFVLGAAVQSVTKTKTGATVTYKLKKNDSEASLDADIVLVATAAALHRGSRLEALGVEMGPRGTIKTDDHFQTNIPGLYAIGDAIAGRCSPTRPKTKAWRWPRSCPASMAM